MIVLGIVGPPAGGKSTVARRVAAHGATWIDADQVAREVTERPEVTDQLIEHFGAQIADDSGRIDRARLAALVFGADDSHRAALTYLEGVVHPPTRQEVHRRLRLAAREVCPVVVLEVALLFESGWDVCCDTIWCIDAPRSVRRQRAKDRGWDDAELRRREARQLSSAEKRRRSNRTLLNAGPLAALHDEVDALYLALAGSHRPVPNPGHCLTDRPAGAPGIASSR